MRSSITASSSPNSYTKESGFALRIGSESLLQFSLRTSTKDLPIVYDSILYGPDETGFMSYFSPVSAAFGTGLNASKVVV